MIASALLLAVLAGDPETFEVEARELAWVDLSPGVFDRRWTLPAVRRAPGRDLLAEMQRLVALRFDVEDAAGRRLRNLGDLAAAVDALEPERRAAWLDALAERAPGLFGDWGAGLSQLLLDGHLATDRWRPAQDHDRDGLLTAGSWPIAEEGIDPWNALKGRVRMEQCVALIRADLASIKAAESDYRLYPRNVGADYEEIAPLEGTCFVGEDPQGRPFSTLTIRFRCDLPFPFGGYTTRLGILNRYDDAGLLHTDIYSTSPDFHWLAGRDVFLPVATSEGEPVGHLVVRHFGFDLDDVPDGSDDVREALRGALGNLKRNAERLWRARLAAGEGPRNGPEVLADVRVLGLR